jgi:hypothetical protein
VPTRRASFPRAEAGEEGDQGRGTGDRQRKKKTVRNADHRRSRNCPRRADEYRSGHGCAIFEADSLSVPTYRDGQRGEGGEWVADPYADELFQACAREQHSVLLPDAVEPLAKRLLRTGVQPLHIGLIARKPQLAVYGRRHRDQAIIAGGMAGEFR